jgi:putative ATP-grasp target RiPP
MSTLVPQRTLFALTDPVVQAGRITDACPFGLRLAQPATGHAVLDLTGIAYDPALQIAVPVALPKPPPVPRTTQRSTSYQRKTTADHQSWMDTHTDTQGD